MSASINIRASLLQSVIFNGDPPTANTKLNDWLRENAKATIVSIDLSTAYGSFGLVTTILVTYTRPE